MSTRARTYRTEAIVLRRKDMGETDRLLTLFTPEHGKLRAVAKGIRKPASRKAGHLELFTRVSLLMAVGRGEFDVVTQAQSVEAYRAVREDLMRGAYAAYAVELLDKFTTEAQESHDLYALLSHALSWLCTPQEPAIVMRYYELQLLSAAGFQPELFRCVICGETIVAEDQFFSVDQGGVVCAKSGDGRRDVLPISMNGVKGLRYFQQQPYDQAMTLPFSANTIAEMERVLQKYIVHVLERQLKSTEFIQRLRLELQKSNQ